jgi:DNA helicase-2/ATP-dependent DNA helicase PcrA
LQQPDPAAISEAERAIVEEEERLLSAVRVAVEHAAPSHSGDQAHKRMASLRSDLSDADSDDVAAVAAEAQRARATTHIQQHAMLPDLELPYFAHMQLETDRGVRDVLLGQRTLIDAKRRVTIVDWREAPVAQIFFQYEEGEEYEQEVPGRLVEGVLRKRRILGFDRGELVHIQTPDGSLRRHGDGEWMIDPGAERPKLEGGEGGALPEHIIGTGQSGEKLPVISSLLDEQQYQALTLDAERPLLILGGAGCGKTTVALHRLAYLVYQQSSAQQSSAQQHTARQPDSFSPENLIVIVPEEGLVRLTRRLLEELGIPGVAVTTIDAWFAERARIRFPALPQKLAIGTPASVIRMKRHPAFSAQLRRLAEEAGLACAEDIDRQLSTGSEFTSYYESDESEFPLQRLEAALVSLNEAKTSEQCAANRAAFAEATTRLISPINDRERILGDRVLLQEVVSASEGDLPNKVVDRLIQHSLVQYRPTAEEEFSSIDPGRKRAVDGLSLDEGTPNEDAGSIDVEDFALLLELDRCKTGRSIVADGSFKPYTHMVLDEAQELSEVELLVLGQAVADHGSVTVAGDPAQQIAAGGNFSSWDDVMSALGRGRAAPVTLETSYRCTRPIVEFGHAVLGPLAPELEPRAAKDGAPVSWSQLSSEMHATVVLGEALFDLLSREPTAQVAIIVREDQTALRFHHALHRQLTVRLVLDGRFSFKPGIDITSVQHVKGLEFDYVVIPDASDLAYPPDPASRRMLHVAATRAIHQLWVMTTGAWSQLLPR